MVVTKWVIWNMCDTEQRKTNKHLNVAIPVHVVVELALIVHLIRCLARLFPDSVGTTFAKDNMRFMVFTTPLVPGYTAFDLFLTFTRLVSPEKALLLKVYRQKK